MPFDPYTVLYFFKNTKVDAQNQPYFTSRQQQFGWYQGFIYATFSNASYQRDNFVVRVPRIAEDLRQCDMLCFVNQGEGERGNFYEYGRITEVEFINPNTSFVHFEIDSWQTFGVDVTIQPCLVEREMVENDWVGGRPGWQSLIDEGISPGPQQVEETLRWRSSGLTPVMLSAYDEAADDNANVKWGDGVPTTLNAIPLSNAGVMNGILRLYAEKGRLDGVAAIFMVPNEYIDGTYTSQELLDIPTTIDGYEPKNSKIFTSEFCTVEITNLQGQSVFLDPELFENIANCQFGIKGMFASGNGGFICYPENYAGIPYAYDKSVSLYNNVQCAWSGDAYKNWLANNWTTMTIREIKAMAGGALSGATALTSQGLATKEQITQSASSSAFMGAISGGIGTALDNWAMRQDKSVDRYSIQSLEYGNSIMAALGEWGFDIRFWCPKKQMAEAIDNFFDKFGYKVNMLKVPNVNTRPYWNYVKTNGAILSGGAPSLNLQEIRNMLDAGVTFWNVIGGATIGDYSRDNRG